LGDIITLLKKKNYMRNEIPDGDIIIGGFPCQGFSIANNKRGMHDTRNYLYLQLLKLISFKKPQYFLLENVKGLENMDNGDVLKMIIKDLEKAGTKSKGAGYTVFYDVLNARNFGVPQNRERVIIFGVRNDIAKNAVLPIKEGKSKQYKNLNVQTTHQDILAPRDKKSYKNKIKLLNKYLINKDFGKIDMLLDNQKIRKFTTVRDAIFDLPREYDDKCKILNHEGSALRVKIHNSVGNRATNWDKVSPTIMGRGSGTGGPVIITHPDQHRRMSIREVARIQCFPDDFYFVGSKSSCYRQIGNAVPFLMAYHIAKLFPLVTIK
jgi:DNA (cytosine-5)-methyltransferase 1